MLYDLAAITFLYVCVPVSFQPKLMSIVIEFFDDVCNSMVFGKLQLKLWPKIAPLKN